MKQMCSSGFYHVVCHHFLMKRHETFMKPPVPEDMNAEIFFLVNFQHYAEVTQGLWGVFWPVVEVVSAVFSRARLIASGAPVITAGCCHIFFLYTAGTFKRMCCYFHLVSRSLWRSANCAVAIISIGLTSWLSSICCSGPRASQIPHQNTAGCQLKTDHSRRGASFLLVWDELSPSGRVNSS